MTGYLTQLGCDSVIVTGTTTSGCVRATVVDAFSHNYRVAIVGGRLLRPSQASHAMTLCDLGAKYADIVKTDEVLELFRRAAFRALRPAERRAGGAASLEALTYHFSKSDAAPEQSGAAFFVRHKRRSSASCRPGMRAAWRLELEPVQVSAAEAVPQPAAAEAERPDAPAVAAAAQRAAPAAAEEHAPPAVAVPDARQAAAAASAGRPQPAAVTMAAADGPPAAAGLEAARGSRSTAADRTAEAAQQRAAASG